MACLEFSRVLLKGITVPLHLLHVCVVCSTLEISGSLGAAHAKRKAHRAAEHVKVLWGSEESRLQPARLAHSDTALYHPSLGLCDRAPHFVDTNCRH